jgi:hypothetical protein
LCLNITPAFDFNFSVNTQDGSTAGKSDFTTTIPSVTFLAGETGPKAVSVVAVDDEIVEDSEYFTVSLSSNSGISLGPQASVFINDNDGKIT